MILSIWSAGRPQTSERVSLSDPRDRLVPPPDWFLERTASFWRVCRKRSEYSGGNESSAAIRKAAEMGIRWHVRDGDS